MSGLSSWLDALRSQAWGDYLVWALMLAVFGVMIAVFHRQDRNYRLQAAEPTAEAQHRLVSMFIARGRILCLLWALLTLTLVVDALRHPAYPTAASATAAIAPAAIAAAPAGIAASADGPAVLAEMPGLARDALIDRIKSFYNDAFVAFYYLNKCGLGNEGENRTLYNAMTSELAAQGAAGEASKVIDAARGSFEVIYSDSPCDASYTTPVRSRFEAMMTALPSRSPVAGR